MRTTFKCDEFAVISIPVSSVGDPQQGELMPEKFHCVFKDTYKVFVNRGKPKRFGVAQALTGIFIFILGFLLFSQDRPDPLFATVPSALFVVCGMLSYATGQIPNIHLAKTSFSFNILSFFWALGALLLKIFYSWPPISQYTPACIGVWALIIFLLLVEMVMSGCLTYWLSKAVCREHFNTLPVIRLKQKC